MLRVHAEQSKHTLLIFSPLECSVEDCTALKNSSLCLSCEWRTEKDSICAKRIYSSSVAQAAELSEYNAMGCIAVERNGN